jgi:hypothetical protein
MSEQRTPLELAMLAAWLGVRPDQLPKEMRAHTCRDTMERWRKVGEAALQLYKENGDAITTPNHNA